MQAYSHMFLLFITGNKQCSHSGECGQACTAVKKLLHGSRQALFKLVNVQLYLKQTILLLDILSSV